MREALQTVTMKTWMQLVASGVLLGGTAALAAYHHSTGSLEWFDWLGTHDAALQVWGITLRLMGLMNIICFASLWPQVRVCCKEITGVAGWRKLPLTSLGPRVFPVAPVAPLLQRTCADNPLCWATWHAACQPSTFCHC